MGYTHYWKIKSELDFNKEGFCSAVQALIEDGFQKGIIQYESGTNEYPEFDETSLRFNGVGGDGHETFLVNTRVTSFDFCKTARKPYDAYVVAALMLLEKYFPESFEWSSDGDSEDHVAGEALLQESLQLSLV